MTLDPDSDLLAVSYRSSMQHGGEPAHYLFTLEPTGRCAPSTQAVQVRSAVSGKDSNASLFGLLTPCQRCVLWADSELTCMQWVCAPLLLTDVSNFVPCTRAW